MTEQPTSTDQSATPTPQGLPPQPKVRVDVWLWSVRVFKTRSLANDEVKAGHVRVNDAHIKPSFKIGSGDVVRVHVYPSTGCPAWISTMTEAPSDAAARPGATLGQSRLAPAACRLQRLRAGMMAR